ncbi:MAG: trypsin-like peptidase domain-containing protein [Candidatus Binatia bacterium]
MIRHHFRFILGLISVALFPSLAGTTYLTEPNQLAAEGARFTWEDARSRSVKILIQYKGPDGKLRQTEMGSGFLISSDGLFVSAYHVMTYCLKNNQSKSGFSVSVDCSTEHPMLQYRAKNQDREFEIELISHLTREESIKSEVQTPDDTIKRRDFVIGRLKSARPGVGFPHWELRDFQKGMIDLTHPMADFDLKPLAPPKKVYLAGYPGDRDFAIARGFLNLKDDRHRGYFAADIDLYESRYLEAQGIPSDTKWGIVVENHMSGGAVVDFSGNIVGVIVNGDARTAGVLSIENFLETFFSRSAKPGARPAVFLSPTRTPLYLKDSVEAPRP